MTGFSYASCPYATGYLTLANYKEESRFHLFFPLFCGPIYVIAHVLALSTRQISYNGWIWPYSKKAKSKIMDKMGN